MAGIVFTDRVQEVSTTGFGGTGAVQLNGVPASPAGRQTFVAGIGDANDCIYLIDDGAGNWELTVGTVTDASPDTLSRGTLIASSTGSRVNFAAGQKDIVHLPSSRMFPDIAAGDAEKFLKINATEDGYTLGAVDDAAPIIAGQVFGG